MSFEHHNPYINVCFAACSAAFMQRHQPPLRIHRAILSWESRPVSPGTLPWAEPQHRAQAKEHRRPAALIFNGSSMTASLIWKSGDQSVTPQSERVVRRRRDGP